MRPFIPWNHPLLRFSISLPTVYMIFFKLAHNLVIYRHKGLLIIWYELFPITPRI